MIYTYIKRVLGIQFLTTVTSWFLRAFCGSQVGRWSLEQRRWGHCPLLGHRSLLGRCTQGKHDETGHGKRQV